MAKIGEGDPRWIVEERSDAANVNNWHWIERDVLTWSKNKLDTLLVGKSFSDSRFRWSIKSMSTDGVSTVSIRKGQIKQLFDLELTIAFDGLIVASNDKCNFEGKIAVPEFSWDTTADNIEYNVTITSNHSDPEFVKFVKSSCKKILLDAHAKYKEDLNSECTRGLILPTKHNTSSSLPNKSAGVPVSSFSIPPYDKSSATFNNYKNQCSQTDVDPSTFSLNITESFNATPKEVYDMFLSAEKMMLVTNSPAYIQPCVGGKFSYIDGTITGTFTKLDDAKYIEMEWRLRSWPEIYYSCAKIQFSPLENKCCQVIISHEKVPAHDLERVDCGWKRMFLTPMKSIFA